MTAIDTVALVKEILTVAGHYVEQGDDIAKEALSKAEYVFVQESPSQGDAHIGYSYAPVIQIIVYSTGGKSEAVRLSRVCQQDLADSRTRAYTNGGLHRVITTISPYRQDLVGIPPGVGRALAQYNLITTNLERWTGQ